MNKLSIGLPTDICLCNGFHGISFARHSNKTFMTIVHGFPLHGKGLQKNSCSTRQQVCTQGCRPEQVCSMLWGTRDNYLLGENISRRPVLRGFATPSCPVAHRPNPSRLSYVRFPRHALHEKGLHKQIGVGALASSQEQRTLLVPVINRR